MFALGIDFGTSGARAIALNQSEEIVAHAKYAFSAEEVSSPAAWRRTLWILLEKIDSPVRACLGRIAVNGTSATVLLCDRSITPLTPALLYNDKTARSALAKIQHIAPADSPALSATSSLVKAMWWCDTLSESIRAQVSLLCHQSDWIAAQLHRQVPVSDYHNALKLGYNVRKLRYPEWLLKRPIASWLPTVKAPGEVIGPIAVEIAQRFSIAETCQICTGTTDSIAAFIASSAMIPGEAVTSLGSTLVLKLLSETPIDHSTFGIYSHRLGDLWLVGGASNTGGAVLKRYFSDERLVQLSEQIDLSKPCDLNYYPLNSPGERFPINDPDYLPRLMPKPEREVDFLYGMLSAIARIEAEGYQKLHELGAPVANRIYTAGGGAKNEKWQLLRQRYLSRENPVEVRRADNTEAAYGTAKLALKGLKDYQRRSRELQS